MPTMMKSTKPKDAAARKAQQKATANLAPPPTGPLTPPRGKGSPAPPQAAKKQHQASTVQIAKAAAKKAKHKTASR